MAESAPGPMRLHHVGVVVADLNAAIEQYRQLGFGEPEEVVDVPDQGVRVATFVAGPGYVELMTPIAADTGVARFLERRGDGLHHVAYGVTDVAAKLDELEARGVEIIDRVPRTGAHGWIVAFVHPRSGSGVLTELVQVAAD
mgnify:CR=1 FL=1